jgi:hypothetical protein
MISNANGIRPGASGLSLVVASDTIQVMRRNYAADELDRLSHQNKRFAETSWKCFADRVQADLYEGEAQFYHNLAEILRRASAASSSR